MQTTLSQFIRPSKDNPINGSSKTWGCYQIKFFVDPTKLNLPARAMSVVFILLFYKKNINQRFFRFYQSPWFDREKIQRQQVVVAIFNKNICANYAYNLYIKPPFPTVKCYLTQCGRSPSCPTTYKKVKEANHIEWSAIRNNCKGNDQITKIE